jgi:hypothetical protein
MRLIPNVGEQKELTLTERSPAKHLRLETEQYLEEKAGHGIDSTAGCSVRQMTALWM